MRREWQGFSRELQAVRKIEREMGRWFRSHPGQPPPEPSDAVKRCLGALKDKVGPITAKYAKERDLKALDALAKAVKGTTEAFYCYLAIEHIKAGGAEKKVPDFGKTGAIMG